jgi:hypothetical protein
VEVGVGARLGQDGRRERRIQREGGAVGPGREAAESKVPEHLGGRLPDGMGVEFGGVRGMSCAPWRI